MTCFTMVTKKDNDLKILRKKKVLMRSSIVTMIMRTCEVSDTMLGVVLWTIAFVMPNQICA